MSAPGQHHALTPARERATLATLCAVQFTHILDYMIMMPLGPELMLEFRISAAQFSQLVAAYSLAAAVSGFAGGFFLDRFDRKRALLALYAGFGLATIACGLAPTHHWLLVARLAAGAFGGLAGSLVTAMVADVIPPERRGRAMSVVMAAFPIASVVGIYAGLSLADAFGWHAPFFLLGGCAALNLILGALALPPIRTAIADHEPWRQMREILAHRVHRRAFAVGAVLVIAGGCLVPFLAPSFVSNVGLDGHRDLRWVYAVGGGAAFASTMAIGWLSDRVDRLHLLAWMSAGAVIVTLIITRLGPSSLGLASLMMALFMVTMSSRFAPAMAMVSNAVEARYRGGFMSVNAALQQAASGLGNALAGWFITYDAAGRMLGFPALGYVAIAFFGLTVLCAYELRAAAPHVAAPAKKRATPSAPVAENSAA
ncbi:MAG: hypothetical protein RLZZ15_4153 [Verrucomicrobiota bacterium]